MKNTNSPFSYGNNTQYDPVIHAAASGITLDDLNKSKEEKVPSLLN